MLEPRPRLQIPSFDDGSSSTLVGDLLRRRPLGCRENSAPAMPDGLFVR